MKEKLLHILEVQLADTIKAQLLLPDGSYERVDRRGKEALNSQEVFCREAVEEARAEETIPEARVFIPRMHEEENSGL